MENLSLVSFRKTKSAERYNLLLTEPANGLPARTF